MGTPSVQDPAFLEAISDVVVRFHEHDQYKTENTALKALTRRYPGLSSTEYRAAFEFYSALLQATIVSLSEFLKTPQYKPLGKMASPEDIDTKWLVLVHLQDQFPDESNSVIQSFISWVIFWHYLK